MPAESEYTLTGEPKTCEWCHGPMAPSRSRNKRLVKRFCCDAHRAAWRNQRLAIAMATMTLAVGVIEGELGRVRDVLEALKTGGPLE